MRIVLEKYRVLAWVGALQLAGLLVMASEMGTSLRDDSDHSSLLQLGMLVCLGVATLGIIVNTIHDYEKRLQRMASVDALTGALNGPTFDIVFRQAVLDAARSKRPLSSIVFDVDLFRQVNDEHGHLSGDKILSALAKVAKSTLRENDVIARWGGEEFVVLLKECPLEQAVGVAEKLRHAVDQHDFSSIVPDRHITISLGVAQYNAEEASGMFLHRAEQAMYKAKRNGRNRLQVATVPGFGEALAASQAA